MQNIEILGLVAATFTTAAFIPQVYKVWKEKSAKDISLTMYLILTIGLSLWLIYGVKIQSLPVSLANGITLLLVLFMIFLKLRHR
ncbi:MAG: SemiSWEET transporter [Flavobacteriaceae bacterium]